MIRASKKGILFYYALGLLLAAGILCNRDRDYLEKEYYNYPDYPELQNVAVDEAYRTALEAGEPYEGKVTEGPELTMPRGEYEIELRYSSEREGNTCRIVSDTANGPDNTLGKVYGEGELPLNDDGRASVRFTMREDTDRVRIRTYTKQGDLKVYGYTLRSLTPVSNDMPARAAVVILAFLAFGLCCIRKADGEQKEFYTVAEPERLGAVLAVVMIGLLASLPCFSDFLADGHDLDYHLTRIEGLKAALLSGQFPVRVNPEYAGSYGMISSVMYPELYLYFAAALRCLNVSLILSYKLLCIALNLACAWAGYFSFKRLTKSPVLGVLMSAFYSLSLYKMNNLYMRQALGEWTGMIFLPLVIYGMYALFYEGRQRWGWSVLAFTLCLQGHLLTTEMAVGFSCLFALLSLGRLREKGRLLTVIKAGLCTVLVNLWYIVPLVYFYLQKMGVGSEQQPLSRYALYPGQLFTTFLYNTNLGEFLGSTKGEMPSTVGGLLGVGILLYLYTAYVKKNIPDSWKKIGNMLLSFGLLSLYMTTCYFPWDAVQRIGLFNVLAGVLQFPMRILAMASLFLSGVTAIGLYGVLREKISSRGIALAGVLLALLSCAYTLDGYVEQNGTKLADATDDYNKNMVYGGLFYYADTDTDALIARPALITADREGVRISGYEKNGTNMEFHYDNPGAEPTGVEAPLYDYAGYRAWNDGEEIPVERGENGVIRLTLPAEESGSILIRYKEKPLFLAADIITLLSLLGLAAVYLGPGLKKRLTSPRRQASDK